MLVSRINSRRVSAACSRQRWQVHRPRDLTTLAIETSCDDTSVAVLSKADQFKDEGRAHSNHPIAKLHFHQRITANNSAYRGIHPLASLDSHERTLSSLIREALTHIRSCCDNGSNTSPRRGKPDFISVTRGPGMRASLNTGLNTAKGLALAFGIPLLGVHHMQAHALTPRLVSALSTVDPATTTHSKAPSFPFLTLLVSGGHTLLLESKSLTDHPILATTSDIAIGDAIDKIARHILPEYIIAESKSTMYGEILERFAFPDVSSVNEHNMANKSSTIASPHLYKYDYNYDPPKNRTAELARRSTSYGWSLGPPLAVTRSGSKSKSMEFSFTGLVSAVKRISDARAAEVGRFDTEERMVMAREAMIIAFEHLAGRVVLALERIRTRRGVEGREDIDTLVVSGGVAANRFLRNILRSFLDSKGFGHVDIIFPPLELCTDNAAMIAWAGMEMYEAGWETELTCQSLNKWSLDSGAPDGGILGVSDWKRRSGMA